MPAIDTEAQFKFLLCCIKHSAAGKVSDPLAPVLSVAPLQKPVLTTDFGIAPQVNFDNVAQELQIVSKAAA